MQHHTIHRKEGARTGAKCKTEEWTEATPEPGSGRPGEKALISARATTTSASQQVSDAASVHFIFT